MVSKAVCPATCSRAELFSVCIFCDHPRGMIGPVQKKTHIAQSKGEYRYDNEYDNKERT